MSAISRSYGADVLRDRYALVNDRAIPFPELGMVKLGVHSVAEMVRVALKSGLTSIEAWPHSWN